MRSLFIFSSTFSTSSNCIVSSWTSFTFHPFSMLFAFFSFSFYELISGLCAYREPAMERWQAHRTYKGESLALRPFNINNFVSAGIYWVVNAATATRRYLMIEGIQIPTHWTTCVWRDKEVVASFVRVYVCHFLFCARKVHWMSRVECVSVEHMSALVWINSGYGNRCVWEVVCRVVCVLACSSY